MSSPAFEELKTHKFGTRAQIYPFTTERLDLSLRALPLEDANVCTVNGSGDQLINLALLGSRKILSFDCNLYALFWAELKLAALKALAFEEFCAFFFIESSPRIKHSKVLSPETYQQIRASLGAGARLFFDTLLLSGSTSGMEIRTGALFTRRRDSLELATRCNLYLQSERLYTLAKRSAIASEVRFLNCSAYDLAGTLTEHFDVILLSNLADYAHFASGSKVGALTYFVDNLVVPLFGKLRPGGILAAAYLYETSAAPRENYRSEIDVPQIRQAVFAKYFNQFFETSFPGVEPQTFDSLLMVQK